MFDYMDINVNENHVELPLESYKVECLKDTLNLIQFSYPDDLNDLLFDN